MNGWRSIGWRMLSDGGDVGTLFVEMGELVLETDIMEVGLPDED